MKHGLNQCDQNAALGLGGNIGAPRANIAKALEALDASNVIHVAQVSRLYETPPWGEVNQPNFLNACATIQTSLCAQDLLDFCLQLELEMGRTRDRRWGPRSIDIDILYYQDQIIDEPRLQIPHPRMCQRAFVMIPLAEIAGDHVIGNQKVEDWSVKLRDEAISPLTDDGNWWQQDILDLKINP